MTVNVNDVVRVTAEMSMDYAGEVQNVYYVQLDTGSAVDDEDFMDEVADALEDAYTYLLPHLSPNYNFDTIAFYNVTQDVSMGDIGWPTLTVGTNTSGMTTPQVAAQVDFRASGTNGLGRKYIGGVGEDAVDSGTMTPTFLTALANYAAQLLLSVVIGSSGASFGHLSGTEQVFVQWIEALLATVLATQRRRKAGVGA
jgi:hypothetical protein